MNNKPDPNAKLLAETFNDDWATGRAADFARQAAASARRRRQVRHALSASGAAAMVVVVGLLAWNKPAPARVSSVASNSAAPHPVSRGYEVISDDQLLTHLHDRPLLVVKKSDGTREIVLLAHE